MVVEFAAVSVAVVTAAFVCIPCIFCCLLWTWFATKRVAAVSRELQDLQHFSSATAMRLQYFEQLQNKPQNQQSDPEDDDDFPLH